MPRAAKVISGRTFTVWSSGSLTCALDAFAAAAGSLVTSLSASATTLKILPATSSLSLSQLWSASSHCTYRTPKSPMRPAM